MNTTVCLLVVKQPRVYMKGPFGRACPYLGPCIVKTYFYSILYSLGGGQWVIPLLVPHGRPGSCPPDMGLGEPLGDIL